MTERLRELERAHRADPTDLVLLRELADERKRRGAELLPARVARLDRGVPWIVRVTGLATSMHELSKALARMPSTIVSRAFTFNECLAMILDFEGPPRWPDEPALVVSVDRHGLHGRPPRMPTPWIDPFAEAQAIAVALFNAPPPSYAEVARERGRSVYPELLAELEAINRALP